MALFLVLAVIALAAVLGYAMLTSATLQNRASANQARLASADYLAESGLNIAMYYLQYPDRAPGYPSFGGVGYWSGTSGDLTLTSADNGTCNVTVTRDTLDPSTYEIVSIGKSGRLGETRITRTTGARVYVRTQYLIKHAGAFNANTTLFNNLTFQGDVWSAKNFGIKTGTSVTGTAYTSSPITSAGFISPTGGWGVPVNTSNPAPTSADLNLYKTYWYNDIQYNCQTVPFNPIGNATLGTSATNPAGIWYIKPSGLLNISIGTLTVNGTMVVEGDLKVFGPLMTINITPQPGFPALVVTGNLEISQPQNKLTANGVVYVGGQVKSSGTIPLLPINNSTFNVTGALLTGNTTTSPFISGYSVPTVIKYDATKAKAPDLALATQRSPKGISILRWGLP